MLSLLSTLGGLLFSGLPKLLDYFQNKADQAHELELARMQSERELALAKEGYIAQQRVEEILRSGKPIPNKIEPFTVCRYSAVSVPGGVGLVSSNDGKRRPVGLDDLLRLGNSNDMRRCRISHSLSAVGFYLF